MQSVRSLRSPGLGILPVAPCLLNLLHRGCHCKGQLGPQGPTHFSKNGPDCRQLNPPPFTQISAEVTAASAVSGYYQALGLHSHPS